MRITNTLRTLVTLCPLAACATVPADAWTVSQTAMLTPIQTAVGKATPTTKVVEPWTRGPNSYHGTIETGRFYDTGIATIGCYEVQITLIAGEAREMRWAIACAPAGARASSITMGTAQAPRPSNQDFITVANRMAAR